MAFAIAVVQSGLGHALAEAAFFDEVLFQALELAVEEVVGLVEEADRDIRESFGGAVFEEEAVGLEAFVWLAAEAADVESLAGVLGPDELFAHAQEVFVVEEEFLQAGAGDVRELELALGGGLRGLAGLGDVLLTRAGGLHHLVDGAVALPEKLFAELVREVVEDFGFPVGEQLSVVAARGEESFGGGHGGDLIGPIGLIRPISLMPAGKPPRRLRRTHATSPPCRP